VVAPRARPRCDCVEKPQSIPTPEDEVQLPLRSAPCTFLASRLLASVGMVLPQALLHVVAAPAVRKAIPARPHGIAAADASFVHHAACRPHNSTRASLFVLETVAPRAPFNPTRWEARERTNVPTKPFNPTRREAKERTKVSTEPWGWGIRLNQVGLYEVDATCRLTRNQKMQNGAMRSLVTSSRRLADPV